MEETSHTSRPNPTDSPKNAVSPLQYIKGVGPKKAEALASAGILTAKDLLFYIPRSYIDRAATGTIADLQRRLIQPDAFDAQAKELVDALRNEVTLVASISAIREHKYGNGRKMLIATFQDGSSASATVIFFNMIEYFRRVLSKDELYAISGKPELDKFKKLTFTHPDIERIEPEDAELFAQGRIIPKYTLTQPMKNANIGMRGFRQLVELVLEQEKPTIAEVLPENLLRIFEFPSRADAFEHLHFPDSPATLLNARNRMKFEELFFFELMLALRQHGIKTTDKAPEIIPPSPSARELMNNLPFELTNAQKRVIHEIIADMGKPQPMNRLLQGDVGSGKTIVALLTMLMAVDNGYQALLLAPTEILAEQHYQSIQRLLDGSKVKVAQIVGGQNKRVRNNLIDEIMSGKVNIIVGTHALFGGSSQKEAEKQWLQYHKVGLVVIDEQHRFGVMQRAKLRELSMLSHGDNPQVPHTLVMSATPIPRTLSMTLYGDLDVSIINELPKNRKPILTKVVFESSLAEHYEFIRNEVQKGRQAYIVYPLVDESEKLELKAATLAFEELQHEVFPDLKVGMLHGQMLWYEKEDAMKQFLNRDFDILVATTVVEVGIDVPNASVMLIQNAERFGLAQLHQLRGRVGRGAEQSYCLLATKDHFVYNLRKKEAEQNEKLSAIIRLRTMEQTGDGFKIAEVDLKLRGPGDVMGTRQSGLPDFQFSDLVNDGEMIERAKQAAFTMIETDPHLRKVEHAVTRAEFVKRYTTNGGFFDIA